MKEKAEQTLASLAYMHAQMHVVSHDLVSSWCRSSFIAYNLFVLYVVNTSVFEISCRQEGARLTPFSSPSPKKEKPTGFTSPSCRSRPVKSIVLTSRRAGVPVWSRPSTKPAFSRVFDRPRACEDEEVREEGEGGSESLPAGKRLRPT